MSIEDTKAKIAVMQAFVDGRDIDYIRKNDESDSWDPCREPSWHWTQFDYRVAPPKPREVFVAFTALGHPVTVSKIASAAEDNAARIGGTYAKFVEVLE